MPENAPTPPRELMFELYERLVHPTAWVGRQGRCDSTSAHCTAGGGRGTRPDESASLGLPRQTALPARPAARTGLSRTFHPVAGTALNRSRLRRGMDLQQ